MATPDEETAETKGPPRIRYSDWDRGIDRVIREAQERGDFDNLPGMGKPLPPERWEGEWALAHHVLKLAGETLPWIALGNEIEADRQRLRDFLDRSARRLQARRGTPGWDEERLRARARYLEQAADLDRKLVRYTFAVPTDRLDKGRLPPHVAERQFDAACPP